MHRPLFETLCRFCVRQLLGTFNLQTTSQSATSSSFSFAPGGGFKFSLGSQQSSDTSFTGKNMSVVLLLVSRR